jgi:hypothetical protein
MYIKMATFATPKMPRVITRPGSDHKFHTIHFDKYVFTVQKNGTSVLAFRRHKDVLRFSKMIESHFELTREWPVINFEDTILYKPVKSNKLNYICVKDWNSDALTDWCINNAFNMLDIFSFEGDNKLVGKSISWDVNQQFYIDSLNNKLNY